LLKTPETTDTDYTYAPKTKQSNSTQCDMHVTDVHDKARLKVSTSHIGNVKIHSTYVFLNVT